MIRTQESGGADRATSEPVAVVGMACRLPGAASPEQLWELLESGGCSVTDVPADRFPIDDWHDPEPRPGAITSRRGGFLDGVRDFDARFFGMSGREAVRTDPRQRLLLETGWEAVADAGWPAERVAGSRLGVWVSGCMVSEYWDLLREAGDPDLHAVFGAGMFGAAPGRLSHLLDARGPSVAVDATCAGGLLALHLAMASLRAGEADSALVAGVNLLLGPDNWAALSSGGVLSAEGLCRFGDGAAGGYVRSEGVVAVVLKRLSRATADGDRVRAVVLGTGASHDGRSAVSQMSPSVEGQEIALRAAYRDARVDPADVAYVEAHGTGTTVGDRVELTALGRVLGETRDPMRPCAVGSVKSNIGHTEAAAGLAGLLKVVLSLEHGQIPASLHIDEPNAVFTQETALQPATAVRAWPEDRRALAGVSSFGLSGANAHAVLAAAPALPLTAVATGADTERPVLVPLSAESRPAVSALAEQWAALDTDPLDLAHTAGLYRTHHPVRTAALVEDRTDIAASLRAAVAHATESTGPPKVVFVFPGQGAQWAGMASDLLDNSPVFARKMAECDAAVHAELGWSVIGRLRRAEQLTAVDVVQPCLWAVAVGLATVWRDWGVEPDLVIGHSMGEVAAATVAGALTIRDGAAVICRRARLLAGLHDGAMALLQLGEDAAREAVGRFAGRVSVSAFNSSYSSVIAGDTEAVEKILAEVTNDGVFCRRIAVDYASHSPHVEPTLAPLRDRLADLTPRAGTVPIHSTLLDQVIDGSTCDAGYWADNLREPVRFVSAVRAALADDRPTLFVEMSPHPTMVGALEDEIDVMDAAGGAVGSLHRDESWTVLLQATGVAYGRGCDLRWERINPAGRYRPLPAYPWQRERYWPEAAESGSTATVQPSRSGDHDASSRLIDESAHHDHGRGAPAPSAWGTAADTHEELPVAANPADELLTRDLPAAAGEYLQAVIEAVGALAPGRQVVLEGVREHAGPPEQQLQVQLHPDGDRAWRCVVRRGEPGPGGFVRWSPVATGRCRVDEPGDRGRVEVEALRAWCTDAGQRGPLARVWRRDGEALAQLSPGAGMAAAAVETLLAALPAPRAGLARAEIGEVRVQPGRKPAWCLARLHRVAAEAAGDVLMLDEDGVVLQELRGVVLRAAAIAAPSRAEDTDRLPVAARMVVAAGPTAVEPPAFVELTTVETAPAETTGEDAGGVEERLTSVVAGVLQTPRDRFDAQAPLGRLGLDSLLAAEVRTAMKRQHRVDVPMRILLDGSGVAAIARRLERRTAPAARQSA